METPFPDQHYRQLFEALDQGFCTIEVLFDDNGTAVDYRFIDVNAAFEEQTGLQDAKGRTMRQLAPEHEEHWYRIYGEVATTGQSTRFEHEAAALHRWFEVYAFRVDDPGLHRVGVLFRDITSRRRAERELEAARREAERANRTKDDFLAMLGHELRNPLAPMVTALQLLRLRGAESPEQEILERQVRHLTRMVDDLLDVSRITRGKVDLHREPIELGEVVLAAMELAGPLLEQRRHHVELRVARSGAAIDVDRGRMAQVLSNLLTNAAKYSDPGSRIVVSGGRSGGIVRVGVKDEGIGLAPELLDALFEPFVQQPQALERTAGGLGLGLAIVKNLVTAHGGTVRAESAGHDHGSEFIIELPAVDLPSDEMAGAAFIETRVDTTAAVADDAGRRERILVVDDNHDAAHMLRTALEHLGYEVEVAHDGPSALARAATFRPSTVLLDIGLPVMDGYEVAKRLRSASAGHRVPRLLALTGYGNEADQERSRDAGFQHHLVKPIDLDRLEHVLEGNGRG